MLEETWEHDTLHEGLPQYLLSDFILGNYLYFLRTGKRSLLRGVVKVHFVCLEGYGSLLQISQNKIMKYAWVPSSTKQKQIPATVARTTPWHHHRHFYTNYAMFTVLRQNSTANEGYLGLPQTTHSL